jgi:hypothetical protein
MPIASNGTTQPQSNFLRLRETVPPQTSTAVKDENDVNGTNTGHHFICVVNARLSVAGLHAKSVRIVEFRTSAMALLGRYERFDTSSLATTTYLSARRLSC